MQKRQLPMSEKIIFSKISLWTCSFDLSRKNKSSCLGETCIHTYRVGDEISQLYIKDTWHNSHNRFFIRSFSYIYVYIIKQRKRELFLSPRRVHCVVYMKKLIMKTPPYWHLHSTIISCDCRQLLAHGK